MTTDRTLLAEYARRGSEEAFRELVARYLNLVYSVAARVLGAEAHLAEDVAQTVFGDLARLSGTLSDGVLLGGWLHRRTCHVAMAMRRREYRRQQRERQAVEMSTLEQPADTDTAPLAPVLDEAINALASKDRTAILLRYFEGRDLRAVGQALGTNEDAAQKRVARALDKLQALLRKRGVSASAAGLAALLSAQAVTAAPAGLTLSVTSAALASAASGGGLAVAVLKFMTLTKLQWAAGAVVVAGLGFSLVRDHQELRRLRETNRQLAQQIAQIERSPDPAAGASDQAEVDARTTGQATSGPELARLRSDADALRARTRDLAALESENRRLRDATGEPDDPAEAEFQEQTEMRATHLKQWGLSFFLFARDHTNRFPETFEQAAHVQGSESLLEFDTNHFEVVFRGTTRDVPDPGNTILFREKEARQSPQGDWVRVYGFADGHVSAQREADPSKFADFERGRLIVRDPSNPAEAAP